MIVSRIGDNVFYKYKDEYYVEGYYQLKEIVDSLGISIDKFIAFGRIIEIDDINKDLYKVPDECVKSFEVKGLIVKKKGPMNYIKGLFFIIKTLKDITSQSDINWFMLPSLSGLIGALVCSRDKINILQMVGEWKSTLEKKYNTIGKILSFITEHLTKRAIKKVDFAVYVSLYLRDKYNTNKKYIIANETRLREEMIREIDRVQLNIPARLLYAGRLSPEKGIDTLLKSIVLLKNKNIDVELWIAGNGYLRNDIEKFINDNHLNGKVKLLGQIPWGEELFNIMRNADILILPSYTEGLPLVLLDAMSQSLPVVASKVGGIPEIVENEFSGLLVEAGKPDEIKDAVLRLISDKSLRLKLVKNGLIVAKNNTIDRQYGKIGNEIKRILKSKRMGWEN
jgi:glycosyltransferase involved in cell wall biosynthesis